MTDIIYCLVDSKGEVYTRDGAQSYADVAEMHGLDERACGEYRYDLVCRRMFEDRGSPAESAAAGAFFAPRLGTPTRVMRYAADGHVRHDVLVKLLDASMQRPYLETCAAIERTYTTDCAGSSEPCLESGCSIDHDAGEICLQPLLRAGEDYEKACTAAWVRLFESPENRTEVWRAN